MDGLIQLVDSDSDSNHTLKKNSSMIRFNMDSPQKYCRMLVLNDKHVNSEQKRI